MRLKRGLAFKIDLIKWFNYFFESMVNFADELTKQPIRQFHEFTSVDSHVPFKSK